MSPAASRILGRRIYIKPTDPEDEAKKGRIAVWLDPTDIEWLFGHCCCPKDAAKEVTDRCMRIRFRASAALHKAGLKDDDWARKDDGA